jgi:hypothetical protein
MLANRSQYELPMDVVKMDDGLMIVCDLPMLGRENVKAEVCVLIFDYILFFAFLFLFFCV